ncbi:YycH family regulatory protein [Virgibacillus sp. Bac332]|uniref:YycH family regulatory protein n=1 Tax=Virgibacillus sp. Bac332 TaxID=2419842 RepID=UPI0013CE7756|nr:two-component system activity regulator YycH [Virgibacillus sp. Bac332]
MKLETFKSFALVLLIGVSLLLTFGLWSYQKEYSPLDKNPAVGGIDIGGSAVKTNSLIAPQSVIFHATNQHLGYKDPKENQRFFEEMQSWILTDFSIYNAKQKLSDYDIELIFPEELPIELANRLFSFTDSESMEKLPTWSFQRMYMTLNVDASTITLQIPALNGSKTAQAVITDSVIYENLRQLIASREGLTEFLQVGEGQQAFYIPSKPTNQYKYLFTIQKISPNLLVETLFKNPDTVSRSNTELSSANYSNGISELRVEQNGRRMDYYNPIPKVLSNFGFMNLLEKSVDEINEHNGWTGDYKLMSADLATNSITYQMHYNGYPVYNQFGLSLMEMQFREQEIFSYKRSLLRIRNELEKEQWDIPSGEAVISHLEDRLGEGIKNLQGIQLGYQYNYKENDPNDYVELEPSWFMKLNGSWQRINFEERLNPQKKED